MVLCLRKNRESHLKDFELKILSNNKLTSCFSNYKYNYLNKTFEIFDKWTYNKSGGCFENNINFIKNPIYEITAIQSTKLYIELISHDKHKVGLVVLEDNTNEKKCEDLLSNDFPITNNIYSINKKRNLSQLQEELNYETTFLEEGKKYLIFHFSESNNVK